MAWPGSLTWVKAVKNSSDQSLKRRLFGFEASDTVQGTVCHLNYRRVTMRAFGKFMAATDVTAFMLTSGAQVGGMVEVLHCWTSGGEAKAVGEVKKAFEP